MKRQKMKRAKELYLQDLWLLFGAIIGAGLFSLTGIAAAENAGPAVTLSFILAAVGCAFAGLCYAEFASMIPVAGVLTRTHMPQWANLLLG
jgi:amino acid transporter